MTEYTARAQPIELARTFPIHKPLQQKFNELASIVVITAALLMSGCASVNMASKEQSAKAKEFNPPSPGNAGLYIYRNSYMGRAPKKDIWVDDKCIGESAPDVLFYTEVEGGKTHRIDTESEFSPNSLAAF